jgi:hypothetical protein
MRPCSLQSLTNQPLVHTQTTEKRNPAIGSLGLAAGGSASIPARPHRGLARGRWGGDWELTYDPNVAEGGSGATPVSSLGGAGRRQPLRPGCRQDGSAGGTRRGVGRCRRSLGRGCACVRNFAEGAGRSSPRGDGNHDSARQGRLGKDARDGGGA